MATMQQAQKAAERVKGEFERRPGVITVGYGFKRSRGQLTDIPCVVVYVEKKLPLSVLAAQEVVPFEVEGVATDVVEVRTVPALIFHTAYPGYKRPCPGGYSIGHPLVTAGTLGLPVVIKDGAQCLLSNAHVIAPHWKGEIKIGDPIYQPGPVDMGHESIGRLHSWAPIDFTGKPNQVDAAIAEIITGLVDWRVQALEAVYAKGGDPQPGGSVAKVGRTTGLTRGKIAVVGAAVRVSYGDNLLALFTGQMEIVSTEGKPFSAGGDSGSAILSEDGKEVLGLLFAGDDATTYANPINLVQQALGFDIVPKPEPETIEEQLAGLKESLVVVWGYDAKTQQWRAYDPLAPQEVSTLKVLQKAKGYWVKVARDISFGYHGQIYDLAIGWNLMGWVN